MRMRWIIALLPLIVFLGLAGIFYKQLSTGGSNSEIPSVLIGREAPDFKFELLVGLTRDGAQLPGFDSSIFEGKISLVNIWASWCGPCRQEHPLLIELGKREQLQIIGINYKDKTENALRFLGQLGNPYDAIGVDPNARGGIEWGVYGIPETFIVGSDKKILHKHVGPLTQEAITQKILPLIESLSAKAN